jgi:hypothetical protein
MKPERVNYKLIETELFHLKQTKRMYDDQFNGNSKNKLHSLALLETERRLNAIENALNYFKINHPERYKVIEMKYLNPFYSEREICRQCFVKRSTFMYYRKKFIEHIAAELGFRL